MAVFKYEAKNLQGQTIKGKLEGADSTSIAASLRQNNLYPVSVNAETNNVMNYDLSEIHGISIKDISIFCRQFSFMLSSGISILRSLEIVKGQTENKKFKKIIFDVLEGVQKGKSFSDAMKEHKEMPNMLVNMIEVGEASGNLDNVMLRMADYYDKEYKQQQKIKSALTYPLVVCIFALSVVLILVVKVLPIFVNMIKGTGGGKLPGPTRAVMAMSNFIMTKWWLLLIIIALLIIISKIMRRSNVNMKGMDSFKLNIPVFGKINCKIAAAQFARTFSTLMFSGVSLIQSMDICCNIIQNSVIKEALTSSKEEIKKGRGVGVTLEEKEIFPLMLTQMIKIGEESGTLDSILEKTAEFYDSEVETATNQLTTLIEPLIIIVLAIVVGFIILSIIMPLFQMYNSFS